jgi:hypothetical protein
LAALHPIDDAATVRVGLAIANDPISRVSRNEARDCRQESELRSDIHFVYPFAIGSEREPCRSVAKLGPFVARRGWSCADESALSHKHAQMQTMRTSKGFISRIRGMSAT